MREKTKEQVFVTFSNTKTWNCQMNLEGGIIFETKGCCFLLAIYLSC